MSWYIENFIIGSNVDTLATIDGNSITDTLTISQDGVKITLDTGQILELYKLLRLKGAIENIINS